MYCAFDGNSAARECTRCGRLLCEACVEVQETMTQRVELCPACKGLVLPLEQGRPGNISERNFWYYMATAPFYTFTLRGIAVVLMNALFVMFCLIGAVMLYRSWFGVIGMGLGCGYMCLLFFSAIQRAALGDNVPPATPDMSLSKGMDGLLAPMARFVSVLVVWAAPATVVYFAGGREPTKLFWVLAATGALFLPMSLLAVAVFESLHGLNPLGLLAAMVRAPVQYAACCAFFYVIVASAWMVIASDALRHFWPLQAVVIVYAMFAAGRLLGGLHAANSARFRWVQT